MPGSNPELLRSSLVEYSCLNQLSHHNPHFNILFNSGLIKKITDFSYKYCTSVKQIFEMNFHEHQTEIIFYDARVTLLIYCFP
jgi:hypothetical protein